MQFYLEGFLCFSPGRNIDSGNQGDFFVYQIFNSIIDYFIFVRKKIISGETFQDKGNELREHNQ